MTLASSICLRDEKRSSLTVFKSSMLVNPVKTTAPSCSSALIIPAILVDSNLCKEDMSSVNVRNVYNRVLGRWLESCHGRREIQCSDIDRWDKPLSIIVSVM